MKKQISYKAGNRIVERTVNYIPARYILAVMITVLEIALMIGALVLLCYFVPYFYLAAWVTEVACVIKVISSDDNPDYKVPWMLFLIILPLAGFLFYFLFYSRKLQRKLLCRIEESERAAYERDDSALRAALAEESPTAASHARMLSEIANTHLFTNTRMTYFPSGEAMHEQMLRDLARAERFIFMEYFIIEEGVFWGSLLDVLKEKAASGVTVRLLYDDIGCMSTLPGNYAKILAKHGIDAAPFSRLRGNADSEFNNRSHRKILVIDGKVGYTGGINLADEYINRTVRFGHWKDTGVRLEGEAVWELTRLFLFNLGIGTSKRFSLPEHLYPTSDVREGGYVIPFGDGPRPIYKRNVGKSVIIGMLSTATRYVYMTTPYLIIDNELSCAIENAALRGVDVRIIVPHIPDKRMVFSITRSFYRRLIDVGVKIYEYEPGFIHAKSALADDEYGMIGTINLDYRSLVHHFENGVWMYRAPVLADLKADLLETFDKSILINKHPIKVRLPVRIFRAILRIFAPMM